MSISAPSRTAWQGRPGGHRRPYSGEGEGDHGLRAAYHNRRDDVDAQFQTATDTYITIGRHPIKLVGFIEGTTVLVVEKDGEVAAVVGGLRELLKRHQPKQHRARPHQATPPAHRLPSQRAGQATPGVGPWAGACAPARRCGGDSITVRYRCQKRPRQVGASFLLHFYVPATRSATMPPISTVLTGLSAGVPMSGVR